MTSINQGAGEVLPDNPYQLMKGLVDVERRILGTSFNIGYLERQTQNTLARFQVLFTSVNSMLKTEKILVFGPK